MCHLQIELWKSRSKPFAHFKHAQEKRPESRGLTMEHFMLAPIQRIPRYRLLLQNLLEATSPLAPEYSTLQRTMSRAREGLALVRAAVPALAGLRLFQHVVPCLSLVPVGVVRSIEEVNNHIDQAVQQQDARLQLLDLKRRLVGGNIGDLVAPGRMPVLESELVVVNCSQRKVRCSAALRGGVVLPRAPLVSVLLRDVFNQKTLCASLPLPAYAAQRRHSAVRPLSVLQAESSRGIQRLKVCDSRDWVLLHWVYITPL